MANDRSDDASRSEAPSVTRSAPKIIKRYSNRKLYDTERSKYVTLDEIARMIKVGDEVTIIDNETKEDLTSVTLTQIIFEEEKRESRMPLSMLRNLIQTGGETLQEFFDRSVKAPVVEMKDTAQKSVEELRLGAATLRSAATRSVSEWTDTARRVFIRGDEQRRAEEFRRACLAALDDLSRRIQGRIRELEMGQAGTSAADEIRESEGEADGPPIHARHREDVDALRARLRELTSLVDELERAQP